MTLIADEIILLGEKDIMKIIHWVLETLVFDVSDLGSRLQTDRSTLATSN